MTQRIGFCCKYVALGKKGLDSIPELNTRSTTVAWLNRQSVEVAEQRLWDIMVHNIQSAYNLVEKISTLDPQLRMIRLGSDMLPVYTEPHWCYFWGRTDVIEYAEREFAKVGELARKNDVRLDFHPGQFTVLASENPEIVNRSIDEFEYHVDMARWMGYGNTWHDHGFTINVHISGRRGPEGIRVALKRMTPEARNLITIENEENAHGLDSILQLSETCALVLDIHHHWVRSGEYIQIDDDRIKQIKDSWRGVRPLLHYSVSREDLLVNHAANKSDILPEVSQLLTEGFKKQSLRAHSDYYWNSAANDWALSFWPEFDICCESKAKNLASFALHQYAVRQTS